MMWDEVDSYVGVEWTIAFKSIFCGSSMDGFVGVGWTFVGVGWTFFLSMLLPHLNGFLQHDLSSLHKCLKGKSMFAVGIFRRVT